MGILAFVIPFVLFNRNKKNAEKGIVLSLKEKVSNHGWELSDFEMEKNMVLGIDNTNNIAFFLEDIEGKGADFHFVELNGAGFCRVDRKTRSVDGDLITERIDLVFSPKNKKNDAVIFNLFDENMGQRLVNELQFANKWVDIFNRKIK